MSTTVKRVDLCDPNPEGGEQYFGTVWEVTCTEHGWADTCDHEAQARSLSKNSTAFCQPCCDELRRESRSRAPTDLQADTATELRSMYRAEESEREYDRTGMT